MADIMTAAVMNGDCRRQCRWRRPVTMASCQGSLAMPALAWVALLLAALSQASVVAAGPCAAGGPTLDVYSQADITARTQYSASVLTTLVLHNDIGLTTPLVFGAAYACTVFQSASATASFTLSYGLNSAPAAFFYGTSNILLIGVGFSLPVDPNAAACLATNVPLAQRQNMCPTVSVYQSHHIVITKATVVGRIDLIKTAFCVLDNLVVTSVGAPPSGPGTVLIAQAGIGTRLIKGQNTVSNCDISGSQIGIILYYAAVGSNILHNYIHNFLFGGIQCGYAIHAIGDCMLTTINNNNIHNPLSLTNNGFISDGAGIYFDTHWFSPGNTLKCNYIYGPGHCYYLDYATSGVIINGGVCIGNYDGVKLNTGHQNTVKNVIMVHQTKYSGFVSCQNYNINNCLLDPGSLWDQKRRSRYQSKAIVKDYPWLVGFCKRTTFNKVSCNPPGGPSATVTGACSGIPTGNHFQLVRIGSVPAPIFLNCEDTPVAKLPRMNNLQSTVYTRKQAHFINYHKMDFGLRPNSLILKKQPGMVSCPRSNVGRQAVATSSYFALINQATPKWFSRSLTYSAP